MPTAKTPLTHLLATPLLLGALSLGAGCDDSSELEPQDVEGLELQDLDQLSPAELEALGLALDEELDEADGDPWAGAGEIQPGAEPGHDPFALSYVNWGTGRGGGSENTSSWGQNHGNDIGLQALDVTGAPYNGTLQSSLWRVNGQGNLTHNGTKGKALEGYTMTIEDQGGELRLRIAAVKTSGNFHEYRVEYKYSGQYSWKPICSDPNNPWSVAMKDVLFINYQSGVTHRPNTMLFYCTSKAVGKAKRWGYDPNIDGDDAFIAAARMVTADYCGTGFSFTADGTELTHVYTAGQSLAPGANVEAGWDEHGVVCLNYNTSRSIYALSKVQSECGGVLPPACSANQARSALTWSKVYVPECGNGVVDPGEECDYGEGNGGECSSSCQWDWGLLD